MVKFLEYQKNKVITNGSDFSNLIRLISIFEPPHKKNQQNGMCAQQNLISAWASAQSDQSSLSAWRKLQSLATNWAQSEDSDHTGRMPRLIWVFAGRTCHIVCFVVTQLLYFCMFFISWVSDHELVRGLKFAVFMFTLIRKFCNAEMFYSRMSTSRAIKFVNISENSYREWKWSCRSN